MLEVKSKATSKSKAALLDLVFVALFAAVMTVCAQIQIPFGEVPFTLQTLGVFIAASLLGWKRGTLSVIVYVLLGLAGVPVFAGFSGGIGVLFGPTGGYIIGFIFTALIVGLMTEKLGKKLWIETDEEIIAKLVADFADRKLYIADGHHRYETALNYRNYCRENGISKPGDPQDFQMIYLVDMEHPGLVVFPTHRLVRDLPNFDKEAVLEKCSEFFYIDEKEGTDTMEEDLKKLYDEGKKAFGFYCGKGEWFLLTLKNIDIMSQMLPDVSKASQSLDVSVLHTLILEKIFGIDKENMAKQINLTYTKFFTEAIDGVDKGEFQCSFVLNPTRVTEIRDVAAAGEKMPQKSTYFYPKMITGMVMNNLGVD
jgi:hypothetical protein